MRTWKIYRYQAVINITITRGVGDVNSAHVCWRGTNLQADLQDLHTRFGATLHANQDMLYTLLPAWPVAGNIVGQQHNLCMLDMGVIARK